MNIQANGILIDAEGPVTPLKLERVADFINAYKAHGVNTITLTCFIPVDPQSGVIRDQFLTPNLWGKVSVTPEYMATFTDLALGLGVDVIWKPQFIVDDGRDQNVNDYSLGRTFYPLGNNFSVPVFLNSVKEFWTRWSAVAEQHHVSMLILGTEQGHFAYPPYGAAWREIIEAARSNFSGKLTYAENHFAPLPGEGRVDFWDALDLIGIDEYSPIGNGTASTSYDEAYANVFNSSVFTYNTTTRLDVPGVLYNLHQQYGKPIFFTEFAIDSLDGAMNNPAASDFSKPVNFAEQANYFKAKFDIYHNYDWIEGINIFDIVNEASPSPSSPGWLDFFERGLKKNMEWLNKPTASVIESYWKQSALPPPIHASSATKPTGGFAGTAAAPDTLVGGFQNDLFDRLGGIYRIFGGGGFDIAIFSGLSTNFSITTGESDTTVVDVTGAEGRGTLVGVEALVFSDRSVSAASGLELPSESVVSVAPITAVKGEGGTGTTLLSFAVALEQVPLSVQTVTWTVQGSGGNSADAADFDSGVLPSGVVTFAIGETVRTVSVAVAGDSVVEPDEDFTVTLSNPSSDLTIATAFATGRILNDDASVSLAALSAVKAEGSSGATSFSFTVTLTGDTSVSHTVLYGVTGAGGNAAAGADFAGGVLPAGVVSFGIGEMSKTLTIEVAGDAVIEADEGFTVTLSNPSANVVLGTATATGTIQNDDSTSVSIAAVSAAKAEENSGTIPFTFKVTLSQADLVTQTVAWTVTGTGEHAAGGTDFVGGVLPSGTVTFAAGETSRTITLQVAGDTIVEFDDFFLVTLSNPSPGLALGMASALGVVQNDDRAKVSVAALAASKAEGDSGTTAFTFTVSLDQASFAAQTADWSVAGTGGNAADGADFGGVLPSGTVSFAAGETSKVVTILVSGDTAGEFNEDFAVMLSNLTFGLLLGTASATGTILNDDKSVVSVTAGPGSKAEGNGGNGGTTAFTWTVSLDRAGVASQTVAWAISGSGAHAADGTDLAGGVLPSGTLTFASGETTKTVTGDVVGDTTVEFDEGLVLTLSAPSSGLDLGTATMAGTVANDDLSAVSIAAQSASKAEGNGGTTAFTFTVTLSQAGVSSQTVDWKVTGTGANAADAVDFGGALPAGTVTFAAGETNKVVTIQVAGDNLGESHEAFLVSLSNLSAGLEFGTATAGGTILDDDGSVSIAAVQPAAKTEGNSGGTTVFTFTVTTTGDASTTRGVAWAVTGTGASKADAADFAGGALPAGVLTFAPNETSKVLTITINGDATVEPDEGFLVSLSNPSSSLNIGTATASGTIQNDDSIPVTVTAHDDAYIVLEGQSLTIAAASGVLFNDQSASGASLLANAGHGAVQLAGTGAFGYTPTAGFTGIDSFTYHAVPGGNGVDCKAVLYVVPVNTGASTTLDLLGLTAAEQIAATYTAFFGRAADAGGHGFWVGQFVQNLPSQGAAALFANIASSFGISDEAKALYPFLVDPFNATDAQISAFLDSVYNNLFNRSSDAGGLAYWTGAIKATLQAGQFVGSVLVNIMSGAQDSAAGKDITTLMGKVAVSLEYVHEQQEHGTVWAGVGDVAVATNLLRTVTSDASSVLIGVKNAETLIAAHV